MANNFVRQGDLAIGSGSHGNKCCGHSLIGRWIKGAPSVLTNGRQTIRQGDVGVHNCPHCSTMLAVGSMANVIIEGKPQHMKFGSVTFMCGSGITVTSSENVI